MTVRVRRVGKASRRLLPVLLPVLLVAARPAPAQDGLYGPQPPQGSAFVRFANALESELVLESDFLPPTRLGTAPDARVGAYAVIERVADRPLRLRFQDGARTGQAALRAEPDTVVTVVVQNGPDGTITAATVAEPSDFNQARARLSFFNTAPDCAASLGLVPDGPAVFGDVAPGTAKVRTVNPVTAQVQAVCAGQPAPPFVLDGLEAGRSYSVWLMHLGGKVTAWVTRDSATAWRP